MISPSLPAGFAYSQSSLQDYIDCPRRFQLRYMEQLQWPAIETEPILENERRQEEGRCFHRMVHQHLIGLPAEKTVRLANTPDLSRWWANFLDYKFEFSDCTLHTELSLSAPVGSNWLTAKYDLVAVKLGEKAFIYDWKTYHKRLRNETMAARMQTRVYRALLAQAGAFLNNNDPIHPGQIEMVYWYAEYPSEPARYPYNAVQFKRDWESLTTLINEIGNHLHFPLTEDEKKCAYCPYRSYCNRGGKAGSLDDKDELSELGDIMGKDEMDKDINFEQISEIEF
jgi:CRISPR/Cas system-associated exonuclease Cas4 (RecB family)